MGRRDRRRKNRALLEGIPPGGLDGAMHRGRNGNATIQDVGFIARVRAELQGRDGYTGETRKDYYMGKNKKNDPFTFTTYHSSPGNSPGKEDGVFKCEESGELTEKCPIAKAPKVYIDAGMWAIFIEATKVYNTEWIALLIGELKAGTEGKEEAYYISKFYFPPQVASGSHVEVPTGIRPKPGTIGAIHSHVDMGVFFSQTDKDHSNWPVEIVINRKAQVEVIARHKLRCGEYAKSKTEVWLTGSALPTAVRDEIDKAFVKGKGLMEAARKGSSTSVPTSVAKEDKKDVAKALVDEAAYLAEVCKCGCDRSKHWGGLGNAGCRVCKPCMAFELATPSTSPVTTILIPPKALKPQFKTCNLKSKDGYFCTREEGHDGYCRTFQGRYFSTAAEIEILEAEPDPNQGLLGWPPFDNLEAPVDLDSPPDDWDCVTCEGKGWVEKDRLTEECPDCTGDGLSPKGKAEQAQEL